MGKYQSMQKYFAIFLALVVIKDSLLIHARHIKPLNYQHSSSLKTETVASKENRVNVPNSSLEKPKYDVAIFEDSSFGDTNAFRPTTPGNSPGVGHRKFAGEDKDAKEMVVVQSPDVKVSMTEGSKNGFKPTDPGHSPGVGHAQQNKIGPQN